MWLLNSATNQLKNFISDDEIPDYAILSHTWGEEEVTFQHWQAAYSSDAQLGGFPDDWRQRNQDILHRMRGYGKIAMCQKMALKDGIEWVWVDACCIDKQSSAELSEAINSMYRWYKKSRVCYTYLRDVLRLEEGKDSRWFQRGWTLQELIAPTDVASVAMRMSWAARRSTSRTEDAAYSLLGIFDINMPLIYGEGEKAFKRLQEEILRRNPEDHTLFAWGTPVKASLSELGDSVEDIEELNRSAADSATATQLYGLLATSPRDFLHSRNIVSSLAPEMFRQLRGTGSGSVSAPSIVGQAIRIGLVNIKTMAYPYRPSHLPIIQQRTTSEFGLVLLQFSLG
ncbi:heterokaryon incompatibility protein-domain-containing protein [Apiospora aurea]|uniref:Heterokaryon incompatibility protein-domain-containing protein n=1 Tax=Apiospora aurea TaxID=335848 RepID=A0ABR1Q4Q1_9PEZI